jgi:hypothetical protein
MIKSYSGLTAPQQLTEQEREALDNLRAFSNFGRMSLSAQRQLQSLEQKEMASAKYAQAERERIAHQERLAAEAQAAAAREAAAQQQAAAAKMQETYAAQQQQVRKDLAPWRQAGAQAVQDYQSAIEAGPGEYTKSPGYEARLAEGQKAITNRAAMHGNVLSGATMKAAARFGQDYATQDYDNFLNRYYKSLEPKRDLAQIGQASAAQVGAQGLQSAGMLGQAQQYSGEAQAGGTMGAANIMAAQKAGALERDYGYTAWKAGREF